MTAGAKEDTAGIEKLAAGFPAPTREAWLALVGKALNGADFDKMLTARTADGIRIEPIYTRADALAGAATALPGAAPFTRGTSRSVDGLGWEIQQIVADSDPSAANRVAHRRARGWCQRDHPASSRPQVSSAPA